MRLRGRGARIVVAVALVLVTFVAVAAPGRGIPDDPTENPGNINCPQQPLHLQVTFRVVGLPLVNSLLGIDASTAKLIGLTRTCDVLVVPIPRFSWSTTARPAGSTATLMDTAGLTPQLKPDRVGVYRVRLTACPGSCVVSVEGVGTRTFTQESKEFDVNIVSSVVFPPDVEPTLPAQRATSPTNFLESERERKCQGGGGAIDPQWVTVNRFAGSQDYELLEGRVLRSDISKSDNPFNHDSYDHDAAVRPDPPYRRLVSTHPEFESDHSLIALEWERDSFPERYRPTPGDRVSVFGYWILDCGHPPFYTEIHPPVGLATERPRVVQIPTSFHPSGFPNGLGANVLAPGVVTDVWFNRFSGENTRNCSDTGLHQPSTDGIVSNQCIRSPLPLDRTFRFNIYLPRDPQDVLAGAGRTAPPVPLYIGVEGSGGPPPTIVRRDSGAATWLEVTINGSQIGTTYSRRIVAAWAYPATNNWGARRWRLTLKSLDVDDDGDCCLKGDGDWRFWVNTNNGGQEWTKLYDCDDCVHGTETFPSAARTGAGLGPDVTLMPSQLLWVATSGYDDDLTEATDVGTYTAAWPQTSSGIAGAHVGSSSCDGWDCGEYDVHYELQELPIGSASLTSQGAALAAAYTVRADQPPRCRLIIRACVILPAQQVLADYDPVGVRAAPLFRGRARPREFPMLERQEKEEFALTNIAAASLKAKIERAQRSEPKKVDRLITNLQAQIRAAKKRRGLRGEVEPTLAFYKQALPPELYRRVDAAAR